MKFLQLLCILFFLFFSFSCKQNCATTENEIKALMKDKYKKKIIFPSNIEILVDSSIINFKELNNKSQSSNKNTIVHFFTADCDKCINELINIKTILDKNKNDTNVNYMFISSAPSKIYLLDAIKKIQFPYPIYYEKTYYSFKSLNKLELNDDLYNTMLVNRNQEVILFGAFYGNQKANRLYKEAIKCNL